MRSLNIFGRDRASSPPTRTETAARSQSATPGTLKDVLAETEAKTALYNRLSVKSPAPFVSHASVSDRPSLRDKFQPAKEVRENVAEQLELEFPAASGKDDEPVIPAHRVFCERSKRFINEDWERNLPSHVQCAVHLELLECFWMLRHRATVEYAESFDVVFGYQGRGARAWREGKGGWGRDAKEQLRNEVEWVESERERVWSAFVEVAVQRFQVWWTKIDALLLERTQGREGRGGSMEKAGERQDCTGDATGLKAAPPPEYTAKENELPPGLLPPIDVLLVWYCYLLLPSTYFKHCDAASRSKLWGVRFPWTAIHDAIDSQKWHYSPGPEAITFFQDLTGSDFDLTASLRAPVGQALSYAHPTRTFSCPKCAAQITIPVTDPVGATGWLEQSTLICTSCCGQSPKPTIIDASPFARDLSAAVLAQQPFLDRMHAHLWIRSPAVAGTAYWDAYRAGGGADGGGDMWMAPAGTLDRAITRLRDFFASKGNVTSTALPADVELAWRTLVLSPAALAGFHPEMGAKRLLQLATCKPRNVDRRKHLQNAKRYGPAEWERCLCWACEAARTERDAGEKSHVPGRLARKKSSMALSLGSKELEALEKVTARKRVQVVIAWFSGAETARREGRRLPSVAGLREELETVGGARRCA